MCPFKTVRTYMLASLGILNALLLASSLAVASWILINPFQLFIGYFILCLLVMLTLLISAFGITTTFDQSSLKPYALFSLAISILTAYLCYEMTNSYDDQQTVYLKRDMARYDWVHGTINPETKQWDLIQFKQRCCGVDSFKDWQDFRPDEINKDLYPVSCCNKFATNMTDKEPYSTSPYFKFCKTIEVELYRDGCFSDRLRVMNFAHLLVYLPVVQLLLGIYALVIGLCNERVKKQNYLAMAAVIQVGQ